MQQGVTMPSLTTTASAPLSGDEPQPVLILARSTPSFLAARQRAIDALDAIIADPAQPARERRLASSAFLRYAASIESVELRIAERAAARAEDDAAYADDDFDDYGDDPDSPEPADDHACETTAPMATAPPANIHSQPAASTNALDNISRPSDKYAADPEVLARNLHAYDLGHRDGAQGLVYLGEPIDYNIRDCHHDDPRRTRQSRRASLGLRIQRNARNLIQQHIKTTGLTQPAFPT